jgi:hypothetical protein
MNKEQVELERQLFESIHQLPSQCVWCGNGYAATDFNAWSAQDYAKKWEGWISRAKVFDKAVRQV